MSSPYLPVGQASTPANRSVIFAGGSNSVSVFDESILVEDGAAPSAFVVSQRLNRSSLDRIYTLSMVTVFYTSTGNTSVSVLASGDGGSNWRVSKDLPIRESRREISSSSAGLNVTGEDLRIKIILPSDELVVISGFRPLLVPRGTVEYS